MCVLLLFAAGASAQVEVRRHGEENPMITIAKSILWGGLAGLVLGGASALVVNDHQDDIFKWSFVGGVFGGLAVGVYHVATRPQPTGALLEMDSDGFALRAPTFTLRTDDADRTLRGQLTLFAYNF